MSQPTLNDQSVMEWNDEFCHTDVGGPILDASAKDRIQEAQGDTSQISSSDLSELRDLTEGSISSPPPNPRLV